MVQVTLPRCVSGTDTAGVFASARSGWHTGTSTLWQVWLLLPLAVSRRGTGSSTARVPVADSDRPSGNLNPGPQASLTGSRTPGPLAFTGKFKFRYCQVSRLRGHAGRADTQAVTGTGSPWHLSKLFKSRNLERHLNHCFCVCCHSSWHWQCSVTAVTAHRLALLESQPGAGGPGPTGSEI